MRKPGQLERQLRGLAAGEVYADKLPDIANEAFCEIQRLRDEVSDLSAFIAAIREHVHAESAMYGFTPPGKKIPATEELLSDLRLLSIKLWLPESAAIVKRAIAEIEKLGASK